MSSRKTMVVAVLALGAALAGGLAQAHGNDRVQWSVAVGGPVAVTLASVPAPVYLTRAPVVVVPRHYTHPTRWDVDGDGIPNRVDRLYNPRWDRDGDGIPNRYDRRPGYGR